MAKYPGFSILYEYGTRKELAASYGVSERTIYRWLNKAMTETGEKPAAKFPGAAKLAKFKGTRKQLAAKYNISERTTYRWLNKARAQGTDIPSRQVKSKYPGEVILDEVGSNKSLAAKYGVSSRTIGRWKQKARNQQIADRLAKGIPEDYEEPDDIFEEAQEAPDFEEPEVEEPEVEEPEVETDPYHLNLEGINEFLLDPDTGLVAPDSIFLKLSTEEQLDYIDMYIQYQYDQDEHQFYNPELHRMDFSPEFISNINIWHEEFEEWAQRQHDYGMYEVPF